MKSTKKPLKRQSFDYDITDDALRDELYMDQLSAYWQAQMRAIRTMAAATDLKPMIVHLGADAPDFLAPEFEGLELAIHVADKGPDVIEGPGSGEEQ